MDQINMMIGQIRRMKVRQLTQQAINFGLVVASALMIWKSLMLVTGSESPIVVVLSGSMEPAFYRGDLLFLWMPKDDPLRIGEITVFKLGDREIPIVHRVLNVHERAPTTTTTTNSKTKDKAKDNNDDKIEFLTKGDNNAVDDRGLYGRGQKWLLPKHVVGRVRGYMPYIGIVTILMNDYPQFKWLLIASLGFFVLVNREQG